MDLKPYIRHVTLVVATLSVTLSIPATALPNMALPWEHSVWHTTLPGQGY